MLKKITAILISALIFVAGIPLSFVMSSAETEEYLTYQIVNGEATITGCDASISGALVIPSTLGGYPVTFIDGYAFSGCTALTSVTIPDSVTSIGNDAFSECSSLTSITIPDSVTSIGSKAFYNCNSLEYVVIPDDVTIIGELAFEDSTAFIGTKGSYAEEYAIKNNINFIDINGSQIPESITVKDITLIENYYKNGAYWGTEYTYFHYNVEPEELTVKFKDGTVISGDYWSVRSEVYDKTGFYIELNDGQSYENPWGVGKHTTSVSFLWLVSEYTVEVIETPVKSIDVTYKKDFLTENEDILMGRYYDSDDSYDVFSPQCNLREYINGIALNTGGSGGGNPIDSRRKVSYYYPVYDNLIDKVTVRFKPGYENSEYAEFTEYTITTEQNAENPWKAGTHSFTVSAYGYSQSFDFEIAEQSNPVVDISPAEPIKIYQYTNGYFHDQYYTDSTDFTEYSIFRYDIDKLNPVITITYADGSKLTGTLTEIYEKTGIEPMFYTDQQYGSRELPDNLWGIGKHTATLHYGSFTKQVNVEIVENPVESIEIIKQPEYDLDLSSAEIRLHYTDGRYEDIKLKRSSPFDDYIDDYYSEVLKQKLLIMATLFNSNGGLGEAAIVRAGDKVAELVSTQKDIVSLNIDEKDGKLTFTVGYSDGSQEKHCVKSFEPTRGMPDGSEMHGIIYTDKAAFGAGVYNSNNDFKIVLDGSIVSNSIEKSEWWNCLQMFVVRSQPYLYDSFYGKLTDSNIDEIIHFSLSEIYKHDGSISYGTYFNGDEVRTALKSFFDIENVDLSISKLYSPLNDKYLYIGMPWKELIITSVEKAGNQWKVTAKSAEEYLYYTLDDEYHIIQYSCQNYEFGDVNCDGCIDIRDLIRIKKMTASSDYIQSADLIVDNKIDALDLAEMRRYILETKIYL